LAQAFSGLWHLKPEAKSFLVVSGVCQESFLYVAENQKVLV